MQFSHGLSQPYQMPSDFFGVAGPASQSMPTQGAFAASSSLVPDAERCDTCGMFYEDEDNSSATESDLGEQDFEAQQSYASFGDESEAAANVLYGEYMLAKQRWRRFSGRPPRRYRKNHFNRGKFQKQHRHLSQSPLARAFASFLPPKAFVANRNPGQPKRGPSGARKNPKGRDHDGQVLNCHKCGSEEQCPQNVQKSGALGSSYAAINLGTLKSLPSMHVHMTHAPQFAQSVSSRSTVQDDLESLRTTSSKKRTAKEVSQEDQKPSAAAGQTAGTESWMTWLSDQSVPMSEQSLIGPPAVEGAEHRVWKSRATPSLQGSEASTSRKQDLAKTPSSASSPSPSKGSLGPPDKKEVEQKKEAQAAVTLQLSQLIAAWPRQPTDTFANYYVKQPVSVCRTACSAAIQSAERSHTESGPTSRQ